MNVDISEYVSRDEMASIARNEFRRAAERLFSDETNVRRIISNVVYDVLFRATDEVVLSIDTEEIRKLLEENVREQTGNLSAFYVFRRAGYGERASVGQEVLDQACRDQRGLIEDRVKTLISEIDGERIGWVLSDVIRSAFAGKEVQA